MISQMAETTGMIEEVWKDSPTKAETTQEFIVSLCGAQFKAVLRSDPEQRIEMSCNSNRTCGTQPDSV